jgi:DNA repair ATPase RecN
VIHIAVSEPVSWASIIGLLSGLLTVLTAIFRYIRKAWGAVETLLVTVNTTASQLKKVIEEVKETNERLESVEKRVETLQTVGSDPLVEIKKKLESGQITTKNP